MDQQDAAERDAMEQAQEAVPEADPEPVTIDDEVPEADALDQSRTVRPTERVTPRSIDDEVPEADGLEQSIEVVLDDDDGPRGEAP